MIISKYIFTKFKLSHYSRPRKLLAESRSIPLFIEDGSICRLPSQQVPDADSLVPGSLLRLLLGERNVRPGISAEYQLATCPAKIMNQDCFKERKSSQNLRAVGAIAGNLRRGGICFDNREEESGVGAILLEVGEVQLEQAAGRQTRVAVVRAGPAAFELLDQTVVDNVTPGGDVQEQVDLLHIVDQPVGPAPH